jgi:putative transposase
MPASVDNVKKGRRISADPFKAYDSVSEARMSIGRYLGFYNCRRPHSSLDAATPDQAYFNPLRLRMAA